MGPAKVLEPFFQFLPINRSSLVQTGVLNCCRSGDCQQFCLTEMVLSEAVGFCVTDRKKSQVLPGCDQRRAEPGAQVGVSLEGLPQWLLPGIGDQDTFLARQGALQERGVEGIESQWELRMWFRSSLAEFLSQRQHMGAAFRDQDSSARVRY